MVKEWVRALDIQLQLISSLKTTSGQQYTRGFHLEASKANARPNADLGTDILGIIPGLSGALNRAETYYCTHDMQQVVEAAAVKLPRLPLQRFHLPTPDGFVVWAKPWDLIDRHGKTTKVVATLWSEGSNGVGLSCFSDKMVRDDFSDALRPDWDVLPRFHLSDTHGWPFGESWEERIRTIENLVGNLTDEELRGTRDLTSRMQSFWALCQGKISSIEMGRDRALERQARRINPTPDWGQVRIVNLRRRTPRDPARTGGHRTVEWSHRWMVSRHWAKRHTRNGLILVLIEAFPKGPPDKPLIIRDDVYILKR